MRLTLRTLLAYLDDMLDPGTAKDIGQRINENSAAKQQVERIREVLRKRRIGAPEIAGPGSGPDPNLVSEYLDNTLSPDGVAELERLCLESDMHLAEVAASHQILTLVLGKPVDVPGSLRERMYALGHIPTPPVATAMGGSAPLPGSRTVDPVIAPRPEVPEYLKRSEWGPRLTIASLVAIGLAWIVWIWNDQSLHSTVAKDSTFAVIPPGPAVDANKEATPPAKPAEPMPGEAATLPAATAIVQAETPSPAVVDDTTQAAVMKKDAEGTLPPAPMPDALPMPAEKAPPTPPLPALGKPEVPAPPAPDKAVLPFPQIMYSSADGVLLHAEAGDWTVLPRRSVLHAGDVIACPEPFESQLSVENGRLDATVFGGSVIQFLPGSDVTPFGLIVHRGQVLLNRGTVGAEGPMAFDLVIDGRRFRTTLPDQGTIVGFDVVPPQPQGMTPLGTRLMSQGGLVVAKGSVKLQPEMGDGITIRAEAGEIAWSAVFRGEQQGQLRALPAWMSPEGVKQTPTQRVFARTFEKEFALDLPVSQSIPAVAKSEMARMAEAAVHTLSLTGNYQEMIRALQSKHEEARVAAIIGLREWLGADAQRGDALRDETAKVFPDADVRIVTTLLWGFGDGAARDPQISRQLIDWLAHDDIAIRELAYFHVLAMTAKNHNYKPLLPKPQRDAAITRWDEHLKKYGALLPPEK
jgi:hypothetical protein